MVVLAIVILMLRKHNFVRPILSFHQFLVILAFIPFPTPQSSPVQSSPHLRSYGRNNNYYKRNMFCFLPTFSGSVVAMAMCTHLELFLQREITSAAKPTAQLLCCEREMLLFPVDSLLMETSFFLPFLHFFLFRRISSETRFLLWYISFWLRWDMNSSVISIRVNDGTVWLEPGFVSASKWFVWVCVTSFPCKYGASHYV